MNVGIAAAPVSRAGVGPEKLTRENYDKLERGMVLKDVEALLGPGRVVRPPGEYIWYHDSMPRLIRISIFKGKVAAKWQIGLGGGN